VNFDDPRYFARQDASADTLFYEMPRLVIHVDEHASAVLSEWYSARLPKNGVILDLMSAWRSHLPDDRRYAFVVGQGMNVVELNENPILNAGVIQDLNKLPSLPFKDCVFDGCILSFSMQYLIQPVKILAEIARVLKPGAAFHTAYSNRLFPTKAVAIWQACSDAERAQLIGAYMSEAGGFADLRVERLVDGASGYDPLYVVSGTRSA
jgi:hypothetical protein